MCARPLLCLQMALGAREQNGVFHDGLMVDAMVMMAFREINAYSQTQTHYLRETCGERKEGIERKKAGERMWSRMVKTVLRCRIPGQHKSIVCLQLPCTLGVLVPVRHPLIIRTTRLGGCTHSLYLQASYPTD